MKSQHSVQRPVQRPSPRQLHSHARQPVALAVSALLMGFAGGAWAQATPAKVDETQTIEVTGIRSSLLKSIISKRNAPTNVEVITAEDVGKMPDKNIANALSRLPGVNVQYGGALAMDEAERVAIRGTSPNLNLVTINGHALSSGDWHVGDQAGSGRSVGFGLMPSQLIGRSVVYKTGQADITEGGISGAVDVQTRRPLDLGKQLVGEISIGAVYADLPKTTDPQVSGLIGWKNDSSTLGVLLQVYSEKRHLRRDGQETFGFNTIGLAAATSASGGTVNNVSLANGGVAVNPTYRDQLLGKRLPGSLNSALFEGVRERTGGYLGVQFKPSQAIDLNFSAFRTELKADNYNSSAFALPNALITNGWLVSNAKFEGDVMTSATFTRSATANPDQRVIGLQFDHNQRKGANSLSSFYDLDGQFKLSDSFNLKTRVGFTEGNGLTKAQPSLTFGIINPNVSYQINSSRPTDYSLTDPVTGKPYDLANPNSYSQMSNVGAAVSSKDDETYLHADAEYKLAAGAISAIKFGVRAAKHNRSYEVINPRFNAQDGADGRPLARQPFFGSPALAGQTPVDPARPTVVGGLLLNFQNLPVYPGTNVAQVGRETPIVPNGQVPVPATTYPSNYASGIDANFPKQLFRFDQSQLTAFANQYVNYDPVLNKNWSSGYTVKETNNAVYGMLDFEREGLSGNVGARLVETKVYSLAYQNLNAPGANGTAVVCPDLLKACAAAPAAIFSSRLGVYLPQEVETKHSDVLPSINLRYDFTSELVGRAAVSRTLGRPNYNELAGNTTLDNLRLTGTSGNPRLRPITANNFDLNLAWYFEPRAYFSVGMFVQDLKDYVKVGTSDVVFFNTQTQTNSLYTVQSRIGVAAKLSGIETSLEYPIGKGFGIGANATVIEGKDKDGVELLGTSNVTYNVTGWFENDNVSARLAWNYRSDYAFGFTGDGTYNLVAPGGTPNGVHKYKSEGSLDVSLSYKITKNFSVTFDGTNLLNPVRSTYYKTASGLDNAPGYWHESGRQFFVNLRAQF